MSEKFTAYITKYALSMGIVEELVELCSHTSTGGMVKSLVADLPTYYHGEGKDWHRTRALAAERAEKMRLAKIAALEKQIKKLRNLKFG